MFETIKDLLDPGEVLLWSGHPLRESKFARFEKKGLFGAWVLAALATYLTFNLWIAKDPSFWNGSRSSSLAIIMPVAAAYFLPLCMFPRYFRWRRLRNRAYAITDRRAIVVDLRSAKISRYWRLAGIPSPKVEPSAILFEPRTAGRLRTAPGFVGLADSAEPAEIIARVQKGAVDARA